MYRDYNDISYAESPFGTLSQYMTKTFAWMFAGLLVTFACRHRHRPQRADRAAGQLPPA